MKISVFAIVCNEEKNIERCLNSVRWADEIIIVDSHSTDRTVELCKKYTNKIIQREFINYSDQKNFALSQTRGEWAFSIDADEEVTEALKEEILKTISSPEALEGYHVPRHSFIFNREFHFTGTQDDRPIRLFQKGKARFEQPIHETVNIDGRIGVLRNHLMHYPYQSKSEYWIQFERYTNMEAEYLRSRSYRVTPVDLIAKPVAFFLKLYILKQGFRDGWEGFLFSWFSCYYVFVKYLKCLKLGRVKPS